MRVSMRTPTAWAVMTLVAACGGSTPEPATGGANSAPRRPVSTRDTKDPTSTPDTNALASGPQPASADLEAGVKAFDAGDYAAARRAFDAASRKDARSYEALVNLGHACEKLGDQPAAEIAYKGALALKPDLEAAAAALSSMYIDAGRTDDAVAVVQAGLAKHPASAALHENLGVALATRGDRDAAIGELEAAIKLQPADPMAHLTLAQWLNVWHVRGAVPHLDAARERAKDDYALLAAIGLEYRMAGEFEACVKLFDRTIAQKDGGEVRTQRALCRLGLKDEKGMLDDLQAAVDKEPTYAQAHYYLAGRLAGAKHFQAAAAEYAKYLELAPTGSLVKSATERLKLAQDAASAQKGGPKKK